MRSSDVGRQARTVGRQRPAFCGLGNLPREGLAGRSESAVRIAIERLVWAADSALDDGGERGNRWATSSCTTASPARISGTTARRIHGSSNASGIWNRRSTIRIRFMPAWKTRRCSSRRTAADLEELAGIARPRLRDRVGSRGPAGCAFTPFCWIRATRDEFSSPFRRRAHSAPTMEARPGGPSIAGCTRNTFPTRMPKSATACTASLCTLRVRTCCSCRNTGM